MKLSVAILMVAVSINLAGCFSSNPSESDAKEAVLKVYKEDVDSGDFVVENVKKTDGKEMEKNGVKMYEMMVEVTIKLPKGINCETLHMRLEDVGRCVELKSSTSIAPGASGTTLHMLTFEKSENGWRTVMFL